MGNKKLRPPCPPSPPTTLQGRCKLFLYLKPWREYIYQFVIFFFQLVIFGGMNDQKDFNDVCILQTRAALKHLPPEMTGMAWFTLAMFLPLCQCYIHVYVTSVNDTDNITTERILFCFVVMTSSVTRA